MKRSPRSLNVVAVFIAASLMLLAPTYLATESSAEKTLSLSISDAEVESEQQFTVDIRITSNPGIWSLAFALTIPDGVSVTDVTFGNILSVGWSENPGSKRIIIYGENSDLENETATGLYAKLSLKADKTSTDLKVAIVASEFDSIDLDAEEVGVITSGGSITVKATVPPHTHDWVDTGKGTAATCETAGERIWQCSICSEEMHAAIPAKGHTWGEWKTVKEPTAAEDGLEKRTCSVCSESEQKAIPKTASDNTMVYVAVGVAAVICVLAAIILLMRRSRRSE